MKRGKGWYALFVFPLILIFLLVNIIPFIIGIGYTFIEWDGLTPGAERYVGLENFIRIFSDARFGRATIATLIYTGLTLVTVNLFGMGFALMVTTPSLKGRNMARALLFMPYLIGGLILGFIWKYIFNNAIVDLAAQLGIQSLSKSLLSQPNTAMLALVITDIWKMAGYVMIVYITGLQAIPTDVMEAADVDGVGFWDKLLRIKIPLLMPAITICLFMTLSDSFKVYDLNLALTGGGPSMSTQMLAMNIYNEIFSRSNFGYGQAKAFLFFIVIAVFTLFQVGITRKREVEL